MDDFAYCLQTLRNHDRDRYLASLLLPKEIRKAVIILYAFNAEVSRIRDVVSDPLPGEIRLQWWRDAISVPDNSGARANPVVNELLEVISKYNLPLATFDTMLQARIFDLYDDPMPTMGDYEGYAGETTSLLFQLAALITGADTSRELADACGHAGVAYSFAGTLLNIGLHASRGQLFLPGDILTKHGSIVSEMFKGEMHEGLAGTISEIIVQTRMHRDKAYTAISNLPDQTKPVFLPLSLIDPYLSKLERIGCDPFKSRISLSQLRVQWALWRAH